MRLLLATANTDLATELTANISNWGYQVSCVADGYDALLNLQKVDTAPVIALIDNDLPSMEGVEIIRRIRQRVDAPYQFLMLIGTDYDLEEKLISLDMGADVFLHRPLDLVELRVQLHVGRRIMEHQLRQRILQDMLWDQANRDPLTNLPNRRAIIKCLERHGTSCAQRGQPLGVLMIDLDHFKQINDTFGHDGGDAVLREVAERMKASIRTTDMVGRFGGEEFMAVIPNCAGEELLRIAERIRSTINRSPISSDSQLIPVSSSIGVAVRWGKTDGGVQDTIQRADRALYVAKEMGRNRVVSAWSLNDRLQFAI